MSKEKTNYSTIAASLKSKKMRFFCLIFICFLFSVALRMSYLNRTLSDHHEWVTAHTMIALENWESQGALKHRFCLLTTYPSQANKFVPSTYGRLMDNQGNGYYASFPPFAVIFPYALFKLFSIPISVLNLQILNLILHLISTYFVYSLLCTVLKNNDKKEFVAFLGAVYFIFLPANLWFFSNTYSWDILWHYLWIIGVYQILGIIKAIHLKNVSTVFLFLLSLNIFLMIYTEPVGLFFAASIIFYAVMKLQESEYYKKLIIFTTCPVFLVLLLLTVQYSSITGFKELAEYFRLASIEYQFQGISDLKKIAYNYTMAYKAMVIPMLIIFFISFRKLGVRLFAQFTHEERTLLYFWLFPVVAQHLLQLNRSADHDFLAVKTSLLFISIFVFLMNNLAVLNKIGKVSKILLLCAISISLFFQVSDYRNHYTLSQNPKRFLLLANAIKKEISRDDVIFLVADQILNEPPLAVYVQRNMVSIKRSEEALEWLNQYGRKTGIIFYVNKDTEVTRFEKIASEI